MIPPNYPVGSKSELDEASVNGRMREAIEIANKRLDPESLKVSIEQIFYPNFVLRVTSSEGESFCIDIVNPLLQGIHETQTLKRVEVLSEQILNSVRIFLEVRKIEGFLISASGSKFDIRGLPPPHVADIDGEGYLRIDGHRLAYAQGPSFVMLPAQVIRSENIMRLVLVDKDIYIVDADEVSRPDKVGMRILSGGEKVEIGEYHCYVLDRPIIGEELKSKITQIFQSWPGKP